jgi:hypothetical protein
MQTTPASRRLAVQAPTTSALLDPEFGRLNRTLQIKGFFQNGTLFRHLALHHILVHLNTRDLPYSEDKHILRATAGFLSTTFLATYYSLVWDDGIFAEKPPNERDSIHQRVKSYFEKLLQVPADLKKFELEREMCDDQPGIRSMQVGLAVMPHDLGST